MLTPVIWVRHVQHVLPVFQVGDNLEGFGYLPHGIPAQPQRSGPVLKKYVQRFWGPSPRIPACALL
jgi:hypothetical protein